MTWNHDMSTAPLGHLVTTTKTVNGKERQSSEYHVAPVWLALHDGKVCRSYWIPETERAAGRWSGLSDKSPSPIAWQHFVVPEHPGIAERSDGGTRIIHKHVFPELPIIEDVGGSV